MMHLFGKKHQEESAEKPDTDAVPPPPDRY